MRSSVLPVVLLVLSCMLSQLINATTVDFKASGAVPGKKVDTATIKKNTEFAGFKPRSEASPVSSLLMSSLTN